MIGIFWIYQDKIYSYKEEVINDDNQDIETGHVDYWQILQSKHKELRSYSYDYILGGRVLLKDEEIIVYSSNDIINDKKSTNLIVNDFKLDDETTA